MDRITLRDFLICAAVVLLTIAITFPSLRSLEFFRHTEADRTLIAWEMYRTGDYLTPHLLGEPYLTKPPLFYWLTAAVFRFGGALLESPGRLVSLFSGALLLGFTFLFLRKLCWHEKEALLCTVMIGISVALFNALAIAEMDMLFALTIGIHIYGLILANVTTRNSYLIPGYGALAFALLTKGPPALIFTAGFYLGLILTKQLNWKSCATHLMGLVLAAVPLFMWMHLLDVDLRNQAIREYFSTELFERFISDDKAVTRARGILYAPVALLIGMLPWSLILTIIWVKGNYRAPKFQRDTLKIFLITVTVCSLLIFSFSSGKSFRYLLPIYPFALVLLYSINRRRLSELCNCLSARSIIGAFFLFNVLARWIYVEMYAGPRNSRNSVKPMAREIEKVSAPASTIYVIDMWERWIPFYLLRDQKSVYRLSPKRRDALLADSQADEMIVLMLSDKDERDRRDKLLSTDSKNRLITSLGASKSHVSLLEVTVSSLRALPIAETYPTKTSQM